MYLSISVERKLYDLQEKQSDVMSVSWSFQLGKCFSRIFSVKLRGLLQLTFLVYLIAFLIKS